MEAALVVYNNTMTYNIHLINIFVIKNRIICWLYFGNILTKKGPTPTPYFECVDSVMYI